MPLPKATFPHTRKNVTCQMSHVKSKLHTIRKPLYLQPKKLRKETIWYGNLIFLCQVANDNRRIHLYLPDNYDQIMANANYKQAAHYDLDGSKIVLPGGYVGTLREATLYVLERMERFYRRLHSEETPFDEAFAVLDYQRKKITHSADYRYAEIIRRQFSGGFVTKGLTLCANYSA